MDMFFSQMPSWSALANIIMVNLVLSGDNAVVIALAARRLPPGRQGYAIVFGTGAAIVLRIVLTIFTVKLLGMPYLKLGGAVLLLYIGVGLFVDDDARKGEVGATGSVMGAIRTIVIADLVMSLDNVLGVAAAAKGNVLMLVLGLGISIPLIISGSSLVLMLMERVPLIIDAGAALLGYLAGEMLIGDPMMAVWRPGFTESQRLIFFDGDLELSLCGIAGACLVLLIGRLLRSRKRSSHSAFR